MATHDIDHIYAVKRKAQAQLLGIPGVHAVGLGAKYVGGERTQEPAILVYVEKKKPTAQLLPDEIIPPEIDGVKTDVMESARPRPLLDESRYRPLEGGIQIQSGGNLGGIGTLGWIAHTNTPVSKIVGVTNHHVVGSPIKARVTQLHVDPSIPGQPQTMGFTITGVNTPRSLIVAEFHVIALVAGQLVDQDNNIAFYTTSANDIPATIAVGAATVINSLPGPITATHAGGSVTFVPPAGVRMGYSVNLYGPHANYEWADLLGIVVGNEITLVGKASDNYGVFTNWNSGGIVPTHGVYTPVRKGSELAEVATAIAAAINGQLLPGINAAANGPKVSIAGAQQVECDVSTDMRIGQPSDCFCSDCSPCCRHRIGVVVDARIDLDAALIELDGGFKYRAEIEDIGAIKGTRTYTLIDLLQPNPILVHKRGRTTRRTLGVLNDIDKVGHIGDHDKLNTPPQWTLYHRYYTNAMHIMSVIPFAEGGDSGSAIVNEANEIVGILFGGGDNDGVATPIAEIEAAFDLSVETAAAVGEIRTVPATQGHAFSIVDREPLFVDRLRDIERELTSTPAGRELAEVGRRHAREVVRLVNHNRRVGTVWRRNGGPELIQTALTLAQTGEKDLPTQINGRPLAECLRKMQEILARYGSAQLAADLRRYGPRIIDLTKFDYRQLLAALAASPQ